jgi:iron uptake system EfeUOB component EfeO/EfeM
MTTTTAVARYARFMTKLTEEEGERKSQLDSLIASQKDIDWADAAKTTDIACVAAQLQTARLIRSRVFHNADDDEAIDAEIDAFEDDCRQSRDDLDKQGYRDTLAYNVAFAREIFASYIHSMWAKS